MAELKRNFAKGKMNKDADERLIPNGEYREATNVQVTTSDDSDVGSVQTLLGNVKHDTMDASSGVYNIPDTATCVGSLAVPNRDKIYYFVSAGDHNNATTYSDIRKDYILEYDTKEETHKYVFVDIYDVKTTNSLAVSNTNVFNVAVGAGVSTNQTGIRIGMHFTCTASNISVSDNITVTSIRYNADAWEVTLSDNVSVSEAGTEIHFKSKKRVLNFDKDRTINAINNVDEFLFFTDNFSEPKKINITRSILGTGGTEYLVGGGNAGFASANPNNTSNTFIGDTDYFHTRLVRTSQYSLENFEVVTRSDKKRAIYVDESHITVIRKAPTQPLTLDMSKENEQRVQEDGTVNNSNSALVESLNFGATAAVGDIFTNVTFSAASLQSSNTDFRVGDVLLFIPQTAETSQFVEEPVIARGLVVQSNVTGPNVLDYQGFNIELLSFEESIVDNTSWWVRLEKTDPLFEDVFPRFSYRYKYQDGEYSTFAPFSQVAFLPGLFSYEHKEGYNLGMSNQLRSLKLKNFHPEELDFPQDVVEIDILYKETNSPAVYTVATVKYTDSSPSWPDFANNPSQRGEYVVTTDMIHAVVPSNQLIRGNYDAVPRKALAQEITANRLVYGNYLQGFNVQSDPKILIGLDSDTISTVTGAYAAPSVKTMRSYQIGVVYRDEYGRITPVLTSTKSSINVPKVNCSKRNRLKLKLDQSANVPSWAKYFCYYVKETSAEYYTLVMDRWYEAEDGHIWISFPSSERNKVEEGTFITLKGKHGIDSPVTETNRYKILAIDNEAPEFITREDSVIGDLDLAPGMNQLEVFVANDSDADSLAGTSELILEAASYSAAFAQEIETLIDQDKARNIFIKFTGALGQQSDTYEVVAISKVAAGTGYAPKKIKIKGEFGNDTDFVTIVDGQPVAEGNVMTMFKRENVLKPEYVGRFFVKIFKDSSILNNVIYTSDVGSFTEPIADWELGYINNNGYINAGTPASLANSGASPLVGQSPRYLNPTTNYHDGASATARLDKHPTENSWAALADYSANVHASGGAYYWAGGTGAAIDTSNTSGPTGEQVARNPVKALNGFGQSYEAYAGARRFWTIKAGNNTSGENGGDMPFYIDACTAYCWTSRNSDFPGNQYDIEYYQSNPPTDLTAGSGTGSAYGFRNFWDTHVSGDTPEYQANFVGAGSFYGGVQDWHIGGGLGEAGDLYYLGGPGPGTSENQAGAFNSGKGQPSRGIWSTEPGSSIMDICHVGIGGGYNEDGFSFSNNMPANFPQRLDQITDLSTNLSQKWDFISLLCTPNTKFRFARDPDSVVYTVLDFSPVPEQGYSNTDSWFESANMQTGAWGIRNLFTRDDHWQYNGYNARQRWSIRVTPKIGSVGYGYNPVTGVSTTMAFANNNEGVGDDNFRRALKHDGELNPPDTHGIERIEILGPNEETSAGLPTPHPGIWETEPKESVDLDLYFQASGWIPIDFNDETKENLLPIGSTFKLPLSTGGSTTHTVTEWTGPNTIKFTPSGTADNTLVQNESIEFTKRDYYSLNLNYVNPALEQDSTASTTIDTDTIQLYGSESVVPQQYNHIHQYHSIDYFNCWSFGNGLESDRVRDDFNAPQMDNGVFASSVAANPKIKEERRKYSMIYSGVYNSINGINNTNQFLIGENITKDINPSNGSIQALHTRDTRLIMFCEDKILRAVTNRDVLYNAAGNAQVVASNSVIGDVQAYEGEYGIAKNPESLVATPYRIYFTDAVRRHVLSLSTEGVRPISNLGMKDFFNDAFDSTVVKVRGSYDELKNEYNLSIIKKEIKELPNSTGTTLSFSERSNGWVSFKSFVPQEGASINNKYYTFYNGHIWKHHDESSVSYKGTAAGNTITLNNTDGINVGMVVTGNGVIDSVVVSSISGNTVTCDASLNGSTNPSVCFTNPHITGSPETDFTFTTPRNNFYGTQYTSDVTMVFNEMSNVVKSFAAMNYEGTEARVDQNVRSSQNLFTNNYSTNDGLVLQNIGDGEYYNIEDNKKGWYVDNFITNLQSCDDIFFKNKEGKYFGYTVGDTTNLSNLDEKEFSVQGIGQASGITHENPSFTLPLLITVANNLSTSYQGDDGTGDVWDVTPD